MGRRPPDGFDAARAGRRDGLAELWRTHHAHLLRYLRIRGMASPQDVASQVWIDVARSIEQFEGGDDDVRRWLFTIAHHRSVDEVRRSVRRIEAPMPPVEHGVGADVEHERIDALDRAIGMMSSLPHDQGEAVMLRVVNDLSITDVAAVMGISEGNVRVLVHRGLARLRRKLSVTDAGRPAIKRVS
jgi:RNA polymerase sigma-70 factor (ECF subfamily)